MTHLTSLLAATACGRMAPGDWAGRGDATWAFVRDRMQGHAPISLSQMANFLEIPRSAFHYSVISGRAKTTRVCKLAGRDFLKTVTDVADPQNDSVGARARAGGA